MVNVTGMVAHAENKHPHEPVNPFPIGTNVSTALSPPAFGLVMDAVSTAVPHQLVVQPLVQLLVVPLLRPRAATSVKTRAKEMGIWAVSGIETWDATWCATTS